MNKNALMLGFIMGFLGFGSGIAQAAGFNCTEAHTRVEQAICADPVLLKLDRRLNQVYQADLAKANPAQRHALIATERHWLRDTQGPCRSETCFKQAYYSRLAELETFYAPHAPLYAHESDKAAMIRRILASAPLRLYLSGYTKPKECNQLLGSLKAMKGIRFIDPIVQANSYESPALESFRRIVARQCTREFPQGAPLTFVYQCNPNITPYDDRLKQDGLMDCEAYYGLPPFKLFKLPPERGTSKPRYIFYTDGSYGPMNQSTIKPTLSAGGGFTQILPGCGQRGLVAYGTTGQYDGADYDSIIEYRHHYYAVLLEHRFGAYQLYVYSAARRFAECAWSPIKSGKVHRTP